MDRLQGKVAIVTGAGTGLGASCAASFAREGAAVVLVGRREEKLRSVAASLDSGSGVEVVAGDVAVESTAERAVEAATRRFGGVDILVNNAGIHAHPLLVHETAPEEFDEFIAVDLRCPFLYTRAAVPSMVERGGGAIVNISSMVALVGFKYSCSYSTAKGGLISLTRSTAADYGEHGVRCCCICPGGMEPVERGNLEPDDYVRLHEAVAEAGGTLVDRIAHVDEVAELVLLLVGPAGRSMTGAVIPFDAGFTAH